MLEAFAPMLVALAPWLALFMLIVARLTFIIFFMPGIGDNVVPVRIKLVILLGLAACFSSAGVLEPPSLTPFNDYLALLVVEVIVGFFLGVSLRLAIWTLMSAGAVIAQSMGLSQLLGFPREDEAQTLTSRLLALAGAAVLLSVNYHVQAVAAMWTLYQDIPMGSTPLAFHAEVARAIFTSINYAFMLAWPFVAVNLLYNICLGFMNKALPSLMVAFVGAPFLVGAGLVILTASIGAILMIWKVRAFDIVGWM